MSKAKDIDYYITNSSGEAHLILKEMPKLKVQI